MTRAGQRGTMPRERSVTRSIPLLPDSAGAPAMFTAELLFAVVAFLIVLSVPASVAVGLYLKGQKRPYYLLSRR